MNCSHSNIFNLQLYEVLLSWHVWLQFISVNCDCIKVWQFLSILSLTDIFVFSYFLMFEKIIFVNVCWCTCMPIYLDYWVQFWHLLLFATHFHIWSFFSIVNYFGDACLVICVQLFATLWTITYQSPLPMGFFRQKNLEWTAIFLLQEIFPTQGLKLHLLYLSSFFTISANYFRFPLVEYNCVSQVTFGTSCFCILKNVWWVLKDFYVS